MLENNKIKSKGSAAGVPIYCAFDRVVEIGEVKQNPKNPNQHPDEQIELLAKIIEKQGWRAPITVSKLSGLVVRGHGRLMAAIYAGFSHVPVDYQEYKSEAEELADLLADNRIAELAEIDEKMLAELFSDIDAGGIDLDLSGYTDDIVTALVDTITEEPGIIGEVPFSEVLREEHNYIVLYFDNEVDWLQAQSLFALESVNSLSTRKDGKITDGSVRKGLGRVLKGVEALEEIRVAYQCKLS